MDAVLRRGESLEQAANAACQGLRGDDRALAIALVSEALRWCGPLDALIDSATATILPDDAKVRTVLRLALVQYLILKTPPHAVVSTSLALLEGGPRRLAHGILSRAQREAWQLPALPPLPADVAARWQAAWGAPMLAAAGAALAEPPPLDLSFGDPAAAAAYPLGDSLLSGHRRVARGTAVNALPGFDSGGWWVQDIAATLPARLLGAGAGAAVIDLCAAPGGKSLQLAAAGWAVTAVEINPRRAERLAENLARCQLAADVVIADALTWQPAAPVDAVLLDAPCSATGIFRRHPDVLYRVDAAVIGQMAASQRALLARASGWLKPGGRLIYATCSLEPEEGEAVIADFLASHPGWRVEPAAAELLPPGVSAAAAGWLRILPGAVGAGGNDGFFVAGLYAPD